jgi:hypothetical protein
MRWEANRYSRLTQDNEINRITTPHFRQSCKNYIVHIAYTSDFLKKVPKQMAPLSNPFRAESSLNIKAVAARDLFKILSRIPGRGHEDFGSLV